MFAQRTAGSRPIRGCRTAARAGPGRPTTAPTVGPAGRALEHVVGLGPELVLDRVGASARTAASASGSASTRWRTASAACHSSSLESSNGHERRRAGGRCAGRRARRCWRTGSPAPRRRAAAHRRRSASGSSAIMDAAVTLATADVHADADAAEVVRRPGAAAAWTGPRRAGSAPGPGAVVAQVGGGGGRREPAGRSRGEKAAAGRQADIGVARCPRRGRGSGRSRRRARGRARRASTRCRA